MNIIHPHKGDKALAIAFFQEFVKSEVPSMDDYHSRKFANYIFNSGSYSIKNGVISVSSHVFERHFFNLLLDSVNSVN